MRCSGMLLQMLAWLNGWEVIMVMVVTWVLTIGFSGGNSGGGGSGGIGSHPLRVCADIVEWIVKAKEEFWVRFGGKKK